MRLLLTFALLALPLEAHARTIHTNSDPGVALFLSVVGTIVLTVAATWIVRVLRRK